MSQTEKKSANADDAVIRTLKRCRRLLAERTPAERAMIMSWLNSENAMAKREDLFGDMQSANGPAA